MGEAKASGNLGNTLKLLGRFDEAGVCCQRHLDITRAMYDRVREGAGPCTTGYERGDIPYSPDSAV